MIALYFLTSLVCYAGIFYLSYFKENFNILTNILLLGICSFIVNCFWGVLTNKYTAEKETLILVSVLNSIIAFSAYNVMPHLFFKLKINYVFFSIGVLVVLFGVFLIKKAMN